jgi:hypothetical protein
MESLVTQMADAGMSVISISSADFMTDGFDGGADQDMLDGFDELGVGESGTVTVNYAVTPGSQVTVDATASGVSPIGTGVSGWGEASFGFAAMRIVPKKANRKSNGTLPVHLYGSDDFDAGDIDVASLTLEGVAPRDFDVQDVNSDGFPDLVLRFDQPDVLSGFDARMGAPPAAFVLNTEGDLRGGYERPSMALLTRAILGGASLNAEERRSIDRNGNSNGRVDLGDLRVRVLSDAGVMVLNAKKGAKVPQAKGGSNESGNGQGASYWFVLSGMLTDGTPFWAEDELELIGG